MKENKYDDMTFFNKYAQMNRSQEGLQGAGEWSIFRKLLPDFQNQRVLDLGCGYGWHTTYAMEQGAKSVIGIDISEKMLAVAKEKNIYSEVKYLRIPIEDISFPHNSFDIVMSSLAFHYIQNFKDVVKKVHHCLTSQGYFAFSVEHPVFTAEGSQNWYYENDQIKHFPVDRYFEEGQRMASFLGENVIKYHRTLTTYLETLLTEGFELVHLVEPQPPLDMLEQPGMKDELRRPMMLIIIVKKK